MLVCKIELWPGGDESRRRDMGRVLIGNVGGTASLGNYAVKILKAAGIAKKPGIWKKATVEGFPRLKLGPSDLLLRALIACIGDRSATAVSAVASRALDQEWPGETWDGETP